MRCEDMVQMKESTTDIPAGELAPAPIQGSGPGWEGKHLSGKVAEARGMRGCQGSSAEFLDEPVNRLLPSGAEASRDPTSIIEVLRGGLEPQGAYPFSATNNSAGLVDQCCLTMQSADDEEGINETRGMADVDDHLTAAAQPAEDRTATSCGDLEPTNGHDIEKNINPDHATPDNSGQGGLDSFQELLQAAMRQSDADRAQDRESARNFRKVRQPSPLEQQQGHILQLITSPPPETPPLAATSSTASGQGGAACMPAEPVRIENAVTTSRSSPSTLPPTPQPDVAMRVAAERQWVRYLSPEGYPYLYDEVTGESEWVACGEEEAQSSQNEEPTRDTTGGAMHGEPGNEGHTIGERDGHNALPDTACIKTGQTCTSECLAEAESAGTHELSHWSQDTSGPDARNSAGETAMHLAAAQRSLRGISLLLANGASVNARDHRGRTPLHVACASSHDKTRGAGDSDLVLLECVNLLLSSGALEDARDENGQTALHLSALAGSLGAARALLAGGATAVADDAGNSPLHLAAAQGHSDIIHLLVVENRGEPSQESPASIWSGGGTQARRRPPAAVGEVQSVFDVDLPAHEGGRGAISVSVGRQEGASTTTNGAAFSDDFGAARLITPPFQHVGARDSPKVLPKEPTEDNISSREQHSHYGAPGYSRLKDGTSTSVDDGPGWGGFSSLSSVPNGPNDPRGQRDVHEIIRSRWQGQPGSYDASVENSMRNADRTSEDDADDGRGHHAVEAEHRRRRPRGSRLSRRRHESARDESTLCWPEALPSDEYEQIVGAAFAGEGDRGSQAPMRSTLSAALFAACLASQPSDVAALLQLLGMHGDGAGGVRDENGRTPLHHVCRADDVGVVRLLCQAGADAAAQDCRGNSPLMVAAATGSLACLQLLVQQGSDLNCSNYDGDTPLHLAVRHGNLSCVKTLVEGGAWLRQRNTQGFTPREDLLNTKPMFTRGRLPKVLRATLEYIERAEASAAQPSSPTWTALDGYGSEATAASATSRQSLADNHNHHHRRDSRRGGHRPTTASGRALPGQQHPAKRDSMRTSITERRALQGVGDGFDGQSEGGHSSSGGGRRGRRNKQEQSENEANIYRESEPSREDSEEEPPVDFEEPSRLREGVWSVVGRAIDSLIGGGGSGSGGSDAAQNRPGSIAESDDAEQETFGRRRPPTDAELRAARMSTVRSPPSAVSGSKHKPESANMVRATGPSRPGGSSGDPESEAAPSTTEHVAVKVPISLTPMQPPPDVLAAMKGRAALGCQRPRFTTPPDDVAAALEKTREAKNRGHGGAHGEDGNSGARYMSYPDRRKEKQPSQQQQHQEEKGAKQELGPFSLSALGGLGKQGHRPARSMYLDYFDERKRMHETGGGDV